MDCEHTAITNQTDPSSIDSDRESTKSEPSSGCEIEPAKKDNMFIWSEQYEVRAEGDLCMHKATKQLVSDFTCS